MTKKKEENPIDDFFSFFMKKGKKKLEKDYEKLEEDSKNKSE